MTVNPDRPYRAEQGAKQRGNQTVVKQAQCVKRIGGFLHQPLVALNQHGDDDDKDHV